MQSSAPDGPGRAITERLGRTVTVEDAGGLRHYEFGYETLAPDRARISVVGCDERGEVLVELTGEVVPADLPLIAALLSDAATPAAVPPPVPAAARPATAPRPAAASRPAASPRPGVPSRAGASWTADDERVLRDLHAAGLSAEVIADRLGRTEKSVTWKLHTYGLGPRPTMPPEKPRAYALDDLRRAHANSHKRWTPEEDALLAERAAQGATVPELMAEFARNENAVTARLARLDGTSGAVEPPF